MLPEVGRALRSRQRCGGSPAAPRRFPAWSSPAVGTTPPVHAVLDAVRNVPPDLVGATSCATPRRTPTLRLVLAAGALPAAGLMVENLGHGGLGWALDRAACRVYAALLATLNRRSRRVSAPTSRPHRDEGAPR